MPCRCNRSRLKFLRNCFVYSGTTWNGHITLAGKTSQELLTEVSLTMVNYTRTLISREPQPNSIIYATAQCVPTAVTPGTTIPRGTLPDYSQKSILKLISLHYSGSCFTLYVFNFAFTLISVEVTLTWKTSGPEILSRLFPKRKSL